MCSRITAAFRRVVVDRVAAGDRRSGGCVDQAGAHIEALESESMRKALPWVRPSIRGIARKR